MKISTLSTNSNMMKMLNHPLLAAKWASFIRIHFEMSVLRKWGQQQVRGQTELIMKLVYHFHQYTAHYTIQYCIQFHGPLYACIQAYILEDYVNHSISVPQSPY